MKMFNISKENFSYKTRYFNVMFKNDDGNTQQVDVKPAKIKLLNKLSSISKDSENSLDEFITLISKIFNRNKQNIDVSDFIQDLDIDEIYQLINEYTNWLQDNPN